MEIKDILSELITVANNAMSERGCPENFDLEDFISTLEDYYEDLDEIGEFMYYDEGDKKTAGLMVMFSSLPGLGLLGKLGLTKWTAKTLGEIGKKIGLGQKLTPTEVAVAKKITQYRNLIETEMKKKAISLNAAKQNVKSQLKRKPYVNTAKSLGKYTGLSTGYDIGYDYLNPQQNIKNIMGINTSEIHDNNKQAALEIKF